MSRAQGQLTVFTIAVIFVVVFAGLYQVVEFSEQPDLPRDSADAVEQTAREAVWGAVNAWRSSADRFEAPRTDYVEIAAQTTADRLAGDGGIAAPIASGTGISGESRLPNPGPRCTQLAVPVDLSGHAITDGNGTLTTRASGLIVDRSLSGFQAVDSIGVLERRAWANNGIGVAIRNSSVVVVYRSCMTRRYSP